MSDTLERNMDPKQLILAVHTLLQHMLDRESQLNKPANVLPGYGTSRFTLDKLTKAARAIQSLPAPD